MSILKMIQRTESLDLMFLWVFIVPFLVCSGFGMILACSLSWRRTCSKVKYFVSFPTQCAAILLSDGCLCEQGHSCFNFVFQIFVASRLNVPGAWQMPQVSLGYELLYAPLPNIFFFLNMNSSDLYNLKKDLCCEGIVYSRTLFILYSIVQFLFFTYILVWSCWHFSR